MVAAAILVLALLGCGHSTRVSDPQLKPIQDMLDAELPPGSTNTMIYQFATSRGFSIEPSGKATDMVVIIRHIDTEKLRPVTARVTFHLDSSDKLVSTEIVRTLNQLPPQTQPRPEAQPPADSPAQSSSPGDAPAQPQPQTEAPPQ